MWSAGIPRSFAIRCRNQRNAAAGAFLLLEKINNFPPIRKVGGVNVDFLAEPAFESGSPQKQPVRKLQQHEGAGLEEQKDALPKHVAPDQGAIEIDAQDWARRPCGPDS